MTQDEIRLSAEMLKTMFNITINLPDADSTDTHEHCERIVFIVRSMFAHIKPLPDHPENLPNHAINIVSNMPCNCLKHLLWTMPSSVCKKLAQDFETRRSSKRFRIQFEVWLLIHILWFYRYLIFNLEGLLLNVVANQETLAHNIISLGWLGKLTENTCKTNNVWQTNCCIHNRARQNPRPVVRGK